MLGVGENARLLQRYEIIERACARFAAGWAMRSTAWDAKIAFGRHLWQDTQRADRARRRLKELRSGRLAADNASGLAEVVDYAARATHTAEYIVGMYLVLKRELLDAYRLHLSLASTATDDATAELLTLNIVTLTEQVRWAEGVADMPLIPRYDAGEADQWQAAVTQMLQSAGGMDGSDEPPGDVTRTVPERPPFERPHTQTLDGFVTRVARDTPPPEEVGEAWRVWVFRTFMNEIGAGDNVASVCYDAPAEMDAQFSLDLARHCWDEYRHAEMGRQRLVEMGYDPTQFPIGTGVYEFRDRLPLVDRLGMLVLMDESSAFNYKHGSRKWFLREGDKTSAEYMMYDICDETRHVYNGRRWLSHLQAAMGDPRTHEQLVADLERALEARVAYIGTGHKN